jgi:heat shock protein HslJ
MNKSILLISLLALTAVSCVTVKQANAESPTTAAPVSDDAIAEKYWKLVELNGKPVIAGSTGKEPYMILKKEKNSINGNDGCNSFMGSYTLKQGGGIKFGQMASTLMACVGDNSIETAFLKVLSTANSYSIDKDILQLKQSNMAPLAKFQAVYLK